MTTAPRQDEVIAFLSDSWTHEAASSDIQRIDTHAATVILVKDRAYKLKRAVKYPYLDYSTLARRKQACEAEVALNRRTAPNLYLGVRSITSDEAGRLAIDGSGVPIEWIVEMMRFDGDTLFDRMASRGTLTTALMIELADHVAQFHKMAETDPTCGGYAGMAEVLDIDTRSFASMREVFQAESQRALAYQAKALAKLDSLKDLLEERRRTGHVKMCHGDLHLRNICLIDREPTLFDCIEFNRSLACIDVLYDIAFLLMDLEFRDLRPFANATFNRYLDRCNESDGLPALPFFMSTRAAVRSHVGFTAVLTQSDNKKRELQAAEARRYLDLAERLLEPEPPRLIAIGGLSGSGKSTLAYGIAPEIGICPGARVIRSDVVRKRLAGVAPETRLPEDAYTPLMTQQVYATMMREAAACLASGHSIILDAVFSQEIERCDAESVAEEARVPFIGLWLNAGVTTLQDRVRQRQVDASDATTEVVARQLAYDLGHLAWAEIDASGSPSEVLEHARHKIAEGQVRHGRAGS